MKAPYRILLSLVRTHGLNDSKLLHHKLCPRTATFFFPNIFLIGIPIAAILFPFNMRIKQSPYGPKILHFPNAAF